MSQENSTQATSQQAAEAAGALHFISRVMARTQQRLGDLPAIGLCWGGLAVLAIAVNVLLSWSGHATTGRLTALWVAHNVIGWSATLVIVGRSRASSSTVRQFLAVWAVATLALWVVVAATIWYEAIAGWAFWTLVQLVIGIASASAAIIVGSGLLAGVGLLLIVSVPFILAFPESAAPASALLIATVYAVCGFLCWVDWRKARDAS